MKLYFDSRLFVSDRARFINWLIKKLKVDTNEISDGYHTFDQLYEHRIALFMALCRRCREQAWKSLRHSNDSKWEGWFIMGLNTTPGFQITYHLPMKYWEDLKDIKTRKRAPKFDGHTPNQVLYRLQRFNKK